MPPICVRNTKFTGELQWTLLYLAIKVVVDWIHEAKLQPSNENVLRKVLFGEMTGSYFP